MFLWEHGNPENRSHEMSQDCSLYCVVVGHCLYTAATVNKFFDIFFTSSGKTKVSSLMTCFPLQVSKEGYAVLSTILTEQRHGAQFLIDELSCLIHDNDE